MPFLYALEQYPESAPINYLYANYLVQTRNTMAEFYLLKSLEIYRLDPYPKRFVYTYGLSNYYFKTRNFPKCIKTLESNYDLSSSEIGQNYYYYDLLSKCYSSVGRQKDAEAMTLKTKFYEEMSKH